MGGKGKMCLLLHHKLGKDYIFAYVFAALCKNDIPDSIRPILYPNNSNNDQASISPGNSQSEQTLFDSQGNEITIPLYWRHSSVSPSHKLFHVSSNLISNRSSSIKKKKKSVITITKN